MRHGRSRMGYRSHDPYWVGPLDKRDGPGSIVVGTLSAMAFVGMVWFLMVVLP